ncbi:single-stranded DNA-binding protein [Candidatus Daviesbacteria bacterium]|nr:single-stranded DNA-binding protein [Candidatus Daviesbacteria bacterium]
MASRSWNRVELIGNLTRDPEMRYTPSGAAVVTFTIATNRTFVSDGEKREEADFHRCVAWNKLAELCNQLLKKGNRVFVSGRLQNRSWDTPEGQTRYITEIVIEDMILLTSRNNGESVESTQDEPPVASRNADEMPGEKLKSENSKVKTEEKESSEPEAKPEKSAKPEKEEIENLDDLPF